MEPALGSRGAGFHKRGTRPRPGAGSLKISALHHPHPEQGLSTGGQGRLDVHFRRSLPCAFGTTLGVGLREQGSLRSLAVALCEGLLEAVE